MENSISEAIHTYPVRPVNGGPWQYANLQPKRGHWMYQPKVNGWRTLVHAPTGEMWNRHGEPLSIQDKFKPALDALKETGWAWFDCEAFERRHECARGSLVVLDVIANEPWRRRRELISQIVGGDRILPHHPKEWLMNQVYWLRSFPQESVARLLDELQAICEEVGFEAYEGVVGWRTDSKYPIQLQDPNRECPWVMKHRWDF